MQAKSDLPQVLSRRAFAGHALAGVAALSAAAILGCTDDSDDASEPGPSGTAAATSPAGEPEYVTDAKADGAPFPYNYPEPTNPPKAGGTLVVGVNWEIASFDPTVATGGGNLATPNMTMNRLLGLVNGPKMSKTKLELQPELASSWETSPDGLKYTFRIREGLKFHNVAPVNGRTLTAKDVVSVFNRHAKEGISTGFFRDVENIVAPDDKTVIITMKSPDADFLLPLSSRQLPIYPIELVDGGKLATTPIGTGPAIFTEAQKSSFVRFKSNPDYWEGKPYLDGFEYRIIPDRAAMLAAFRVGQIGYGLIGLQKAEADKLLETNPTVQINTDPVLFTTFSWGFNLNNPKFQDDRVRRALSLAFDRKRVEQIAYQGWAKTLPTIPWPMIFDKTPSGADLGPWWRYDPTEAKSLLQAAGVQKLEFDLMYSRAFGEGHTSRTQATAAALQEQGINVRIVDADYTQFLSQWLSVKYPEAADGYWTVPVSANAFFFEHLESKSPNNRWYIKDPDIDRWAAEQKREFDPNKRKEIWRKEWDRMLDRVYRIDQVQAFELKQYQPWLRYVRFNGAYGGISQTFDWNLSYRNTWIDM